MAAAASFTIPATLIDLWLSGPIVHGIDSSYPWGLHLVLRLIAGTLLALLILRIWPNLRIRKAYFATIWMGVLLVGADLYFVMAVDRAWTVGLGTECRATLGDSKNPSLSVPVVDEVVLRDILDGSLLSGRARHTAPCSTASNPGSGVNDAAARFSDFAVAIISQTRGRPAGAA